MMTTQTLRRATRVFAISIAPVAMGLGLAACSSDTAKAEPCPAKVDLDLTAKEYKFVPNKLEVKAGKVVVRLTQGGAINHTFEIHGADGKATVSSDTKSACATFTLAKGDYKFFCGISGHEGQGMKGDLTVS